MSACESKCLDALRIVVLAGGPSLERPISLQSGEAVARSLSERGHSITVIDPRDTDLKTYSWKTTDAVFLALHGTYGEDGQVQQVLEDAGVPFTGSDSTTSRLAFSKSASKERFIQHGVPTPAYVLIHQSDSPAAIRQHARAIGYPLVVKPDRQGSSLGVTIVFDKQDLEDAVHACFEVDSFGVLEPAIEGMEWTVGFLDELTLPAIQIVTGRQFFDYQAKYEDDDTQYEFHTATSSAAHAVVQAARYAYDALGTQGVARVDLRVDRLHRPWVLEVNTVPGFTDHSLVPKAAEQIGLDLGTLCERAILACLTSPLSDTIARTA